MGDRSIAFPKINSSKLITVKHYHLFDFYPNPIEQCLLLACPQIAAGISGEKILSEVI